MKPCSDSSDDHRYIFVFCHCNAVTHFDELICIIREIRMIAVKFYQVKLIQKNVIIPPRLDDTIHPSETDLVFFHLQFSQCEGMYYVVKLCDQNDDIFSSQFFGIKFTAINELTSNELDYFIKTCHCWCCGENKNKLHFLRSD